MISQGHCFCVWVLLFITCTCAAARGSKRNTASFQREIDGRKEEIENIYNVAQAKINGSLDVRITGAKDLAGRLTECLDVDNGTQCLISFLVAVVNMPEFENYPIPDPGDCEADRVSGSLLRFRRTVKDWFGERLASLRECEEHPLILSCDGGDCDTSEDFWYAVGEWSQNLRDILQSLGSLCVGRDVDIEETINTPLRERCRAVAREKRREKKEAKKQRAAERAEKKKQAKLRKQEKKRKQRKRAKKQKNRENKNNKESSGRQTD